MENLRQLMRRLRKGEKIMFKWFRRKFEKRSMDLPVHFVDSCEDPNTVYVEFPDGLRLIIRDGKYEGHYVA